MVRDHAVSCVFENILIDLFSTPFGSNNNYGKMVDRSPPMPITMDFGAGGKFSVYGLFCYSWQLTCGMNEVS